MLTVNVKIVAYELMPGLTGGEYKIDAGSTIRDLLALCEKLCGTTIPLNNFSAMYPLFNGKPAGLDSKILEDGTLHLCRVVTGG
jgi:hypothetical protein